LHQPQTAPKTFLASAFNAAHRAVLSAASAIKETFLETPRERMRLGLEHLRRIRTSQPLAEPTHEMRVADLIDAYADPALHPDIERIARAMTSRAYKSGHCYATQETIARWTRIPRATLQLRLHEMERLHLMRVQRRPGTSSITIFADGTLDALRLKKINKIKVRERIAPYVARTCTAPAATNPHETGIRRDQNVDSWPKNTMCSQKTLSRTNPVISAKSLPHVKPEVILPARTRTKPPVKAVERQKTPPKQQAPKPQTMLPALHVAAKPTTRQNGNEGTGKAVPPSASSHPKPSAAAVAMLIAEGVTPARARCFASLFEPERIARTIALDLHRAKNSPPGYLLRLIQDDAAAKRIAPGSEADRVRQRERPGVARGRIGPEDARETREPVNADISPPRPPSRGSGAISGTFSGASEPPAAFEDSLRALPPEDRAFYARRAREEVFRATPWLGASARERNGPMMQAMIRKQLRVMLAVADTPTSRGAPAG
jgi:hypothetical protein